MILLQNEKLSASIDDKGAELQQLTSRISNINYLWKGDAKYWGKYSPVLFPIIGGLIDDTYYHNNEAYQLPRHGFARDKVFIAEQISDTEAVFTLNDDEQTRKVYPFAFTLRVHYSLVQNQLICKYEIHNPGNTPLLFSIGAHPAFAVPLTEGLNYNDYYLAFNKTEELFRFKLLNGLIDDKKKLMPLLNNKLILTADLFYEDAIVLKAMKSNQLTLASTKNPHGLHFNFNDFGFFGIWAVKDASFVCLEPWCGIADGINHNQQLAEKEGINKLSPGQYFLRSWNVECF